MTAGTIRDAAIVLADGTVFEGEAIGAEASGGVATGEFVFNTVLSGYQEVISDPSYAGQVITFTYPHIGNYGVNAADDESTRPACSGVVVRDLARRHSNHRAEGGLDAYLGRHGISGVAGIDTRRLTRHLRDHGAQPGAFGTADEATLTTAARGAAGTDGHDLVAVVTCRDDDDRAVGDGGDRGGSSPSTWGSRPRSSPTSRGSATSMLVPAGDLGRRHHRHGTRRRLPVERARRSCRRRRRGGHGFVPCSARCPCSGSAWATRCWPRHSAARPSSSRSVTTVATTRSRPPDREGRDHQPEPQLLRGRRLDSTGSRSPTGT